MGWYEPLNRLKTAKKGLKATLSLPWGVLQSTGQVNKMKLQEEKSHCTRTREKKGILDYLGDLSFNFSSQKLMRSRAERHAGKVTKKPILPRPDHHTQHPVSTAGAQGAGAAIRNC